MTTMPLDRPFGNLTFSRYTLETEAERCVVALQAALNVRGPAGIAGSLKKLQRLKKTMQKNPVRKYSFALVQKITPPKPVEDSAPDVSGDQAELVAAAATEITRLAFHSKETRIATSGHFIVKLVLVGSLSKFRLPPGRNSDLTLDKARSEFASLILKRHKDTISSFIVQPFRVRVDGSKKRAAVSIQCVYRVFGAAQTY